MAFNAQETAKVISRRQTNKQQTHTQTNKQTHTQTNKQTHTQTNKQTKTEESYLHRLQPRLVDGLDQDVEGRALGQGRVELLVVRVVVGALERGQVRDAGGTGRCQADLVVEDTAVCVTSGPVQKELGGKIDR